MSFNLIAATSLFEQLHGPKWTEDESGKREKLKSILLSLGKQMLQSQKMVYHYCDPKSASLIIQTGLRASDSGCMDGGGVFFSALSPLDHGWPGKNWQSNLLTANYGPKRGKLKENQISSACCIVVGIDRDNLKPVTGRPTALVMPYKVCQALGRKAADGLFYVRHGKNEETGLTAMTYLKTFELYPQKAFDFSDVEEHKLEAARTGQQFQQDLQFQQHLQFQQDLQFQQMIHEQHSMVPCLACGQVAVPQAPVGWQVQCQACGLPYVGS